MTDTLPFLLGPTPDLQISLANHQAGRYADAARGYQSLLEQNPEDVAALHLFGVMHKQCGYPERAVELISAAIVLRPDVAAFHANVAEAHRELKHFDLAADCCREALRLQPDYPEAANNLGLALHGLGRFDEALAQFDAALALRPGVATVENNRGTSLIKLGKADDAIAAYRKAISLDPALAMARSNLSQLLIVGEQPAEGLSHAEEAVRLEPSLAAVHNNLGNALRVFQRWPEARAAYAEAIRLQADLATAHANLGLTLQLEGEIGAAVPYFQRAGELAPGDAGIQKQLATIHALNEDWPQAIPFCERRVELKPDDPDAHSDLGFAYQSDQRLPEAEAAFRRALELDSGHLDALLNMGHLFEQKGSMAEAESCYRLAEAGHPLSVLPLAQRALLAPGRLSDADRDRLRFALYKQDGPASPRMNVLFALAYVADARGEHAEAAACLEPANALAGRMRRAGGQRYDPQEHTRYVDRLIGGFTPELFARLGAAGDDTTQPVFVFGMPRSGTTLVEQVLGSHSQIHGAGELGLIRRAMDDLPAPEKEPAELAALLQSLDAAGLRRLARDYRDGLRSVLKRQGIDTEPARVVDKMPDNYLYLGLISLLFPRATLIHVRRDLRDVAVSCWQTRFRSIRWSDDTEHLAGRIQNYRRLTDHWRAVLPRTVHEVCYERLVENFEPEARRLVALCGLEWEPACLAFHQTSRPVQTASLTQVRQPLYRRSLGRWRLYEPYLASLFEHLPRDCEDA